LRPKRAAKRYTQATAALQNFCKEKRRTLQIIGAKKHDQRSESAAKAQWIGSTQSRIIHSSPGSPIMSDFLAIGSSIPLLANAQNPEEPAPVASDFTGNGNGSPLIADAVIDGGINGCVDEGSPERGTSRGLVVGNGGNGLAFSDGVVYSFGDLLPRGLISDSGGEAFFRAPRRGSVSNGTGNLVVPGSGTDPFAAPLTTLI
jgi:hypothetical protein